MSPKTQARTTITHTTTEVPLPKPDLAASNVQRAERLGGIRELAAFIRAHGLLQPLAVRPKLDSDGQHLHSGIGYRTPAEARADMLQSNLPMGA